MTRVDLSEGSIDLDFMPSTSETERRDNRFLCVRRPPVTTTAFMSAAIMSSENCARLEKSNSLRVNRETAAAAAVYRRVMEFVPDHAGRRQYSGASQAREFDAALKYQPVCSLRRPSAGSSPLRREA